MRKEYYNILLHSIYLFFFLCTLEITKKVRHGESWVTFADARGIEKAERPPLRMSRRVCHPSNYILAFKQKEPVGLLDMLLLSQINGFNQKKRFLQSPVFQFVKHSHQGKCIAFAGNNVSFLPERIFVGNAKKRLRNVVRKMYNCGCM